MAGFSRGSDSHQLNKPMDHCGTGMRLQTVISVNLRDIIMFPPNYSQRENYKIRMRYPMFSVSHFELKKQSSGLPAKKYSVSHHKLYSSHDRNRSVERFPSWELYNL